MKELSSVQINQIAVMWSAAILLACDLSSFENDDFKQDSEVIKRVHKIAVSLLNGKPALTSLPEIIQYVKTVKKP